MQFTNFNYRSFAALVSLSTLTVGLAFGLSACSGGGGGGQAAAVPLTAAQKAQLDITAVNVAEVSNWETQSKLGTPLFAVQAAGTTSTERSSAIAKADIQRKIFDPSVCVVKISEPPQSVPGRNPSMPGSDPSIPLGFDLEIGASIGGLSCPISFAWTNKTSQKIDQVAQSASMTADFAIDFKGQSTQAQAFDIELYQLRMQMAFNMSKDGGSGSMTGSGQIVSRSQGTITVAINGNIQATQQSMDATMVVTMNYPNGLLVEFKQVEKQNSQTGKPDKSYFINNVAVTEREFNQYSKSFGLDKMSDTEVSKSTPARR